MKTPWKPESIGLFLVVLVACGFGPMQAASTSDSSSDGSSSTSSDVDPPPDLPGSQVSGESGSRTTSSPAWESSGEAPSGSSSDGGGSDAETGSTSASPGSSGTTEAGGGSTTSRGECHACCEPHAGAGGCETDDDVSACVCSWSDGTTNGSACCTVVWSVWCTELAAEVCGMECNACR